MPTQPHRLVPLQRVDVVVEKQRVVGDVGRDERAVAPPYRRARSLKVRNLGHLAKLAAKFALPIMR